MRFIALMAVAFVLDGLADQPGVTLVVSKEYREIPTPVFSIPAEEVRVSTFYPDGYSIWMRSPMPKFIDVAAFTTLVKVEWNTEPGTDYGVETSTDLKTWSNRNLRIKGDGISFKLFDFPTEPKLHYRVKTLL